MEEVAIGRPTFEGIAATKLKTVSSLAEYIRQKHPTAIVAISQVNEAIRVGGQFRPLRLECTFGPVDTITFDPNTGYVHLR